MTYKLLLHNTLWVKNFNTGMESSSLKKQIHTLTNLLFIIDYLKKWTLSAYVLHFELLNAKRLF